MSSCDTPPPQPPLNRSSFFPEWTKKSRWNFRMHYLVFKVVRSMNNSHTCENERTAFSYLAGWQVANLYHHNINSALPAPLELFLNQQFSPLVELGSGKSSQTSLALQVLVRPEGLFMRGKHVFGEELFNYTPFSSAYFFQLWSLTVVCGRKTPVAFSCAVVCTGVTLANL